MHTRFISDYHMNNIYKKQFKNMKNLIEKLKTKIGCELYNDGSERTIENILNDKEILNKIGRVIVENRMQKVLYLYNFLISIEDFSDRIDWYFIFKSMINLNSENIVNTNSVIICANSFFGYKYVSFSVYDFCRSIGKFPDTIDFVHVHPGYPGDSVSLKTYYITYFNFSFLRLLFLFISNYDLDKIIKIEKLKLKE